MKFLFISFFFLSLYPYAGVWARTATVKGIILDEADRPIAGVNITYEGGGTTSDESGFYLLRIPADTDITLVFSHLAFKNTTQRVNLRRNEDVEFHPVMKADVEQISEVVLTSRNRKRIAGITSLAPETVRRIPGANAGVENLLKSLPGVSGNNELSTQYSVRGGNYDENLVYINEIEVYRPFLVRSGQQEGLSIVNSALTSAVDFSAGGFQAKYGDRLSSVLDITYKRPTGFEASADLNMLGASVAAGGISRNGRLSGIGGIRYRDNNLLLGSLETQANLRPIFTDAQAYLSYKFNDRFELGFLGNIAVNKYEFTPFSRRTRFGTVADARELIVFYEGKEDDRYDTYFGALKASWVANDCWDMRLIASVYHTREQEFFDILANYRLADVEFDLGGDSGTDPLEFSTEAGSQLTHARNKLDALIVNLEYKGDYTAGDDLFQYGIKYTHEDIRDRVREYEIIDSAGFSVRPPFPEFINDQPYTPFDAPLAPFTDVRAQNDVQIDRFSGFLQWSRQANLGTDKIWINAGIRTHNWNVSGEGIPGSRSQIVFSPRGQLSLKPDWEADMLFRLSGGVYHQPPFYRELRDMSGVVQPDVKAQQSVHIVLGNDYSFDLWDRPFVLYSEAYYKILSDVNTYTLENVRIRYRADNDAKAYAYGLDLRLTGAFVPGTESWVSFGYLKTEENHNDRGYISRPTDQRLKFGVMFQDYMPLFPQAKMYLNMVYNTGLPGGSPNYADPYLFQHRLKDYFRTDIGLFYVLTEAENLREKRWLKPFKELSFGLEIFNLFDVQNAITNTFVRDAGNKVQYAIPNYLTPRVYNLSLSARL